LRQIGTIADERQAKLLADHLLTRGITSRLDRSGSEWIVWVHREEKVEEAKTELKLFLENPDDPRYLGAEPSARAIRKEAERKERLHQRNTINLRDRWRYRPAERCRLTLILMIASIATTLVANFGWNTTVEQMVIVATYREVRPTDPNPPTDATFVADLGARQIRSNVLNDLRRGEFWRLITPIFLHRNWWHLVFNMIWLFDLGGLIEMRQGTRKLAILVLVTAIITNLVQYYYKHVPTFSGMSGVDYALFGYIWMKSQYDPALGLRLRSDTVLTMMAWLVICLTGVMPHSPNAANFAGLFIGVVFGVAPHLFDELRL
jgi:GlpG protein